jgi:hypothetical protein
MSPLPAYRLPPRRSEGLPWGTATQPGICSAEGPDARPDDPGPFTQGLAHRDQRMFHVERAGESAQSLERQFHVEQSQVLTSGRRQARIGGVPRRFRSPT